MSAFTDLTHSVLVVSADDRRFEEVYRPALGVASALDGIGLVAVRLDPRGRSDTASDEELDALEHGACVLADLEGVTPGLFALLSWHARAEPQSVLLLRAGLGALPFEVRDLGVLPLELDGPRGAGGARTDLAQRLTVGAAARAGGEREGLRRREARWRRRSRTGVLLSLRLADCLVMAGELDGALERLDAALAIEPEASDLRVRRALLRREQGRWEEACDDLEAAVTSEPASVAAWRELGIVRHRLGHRDAISALERSVALAPDYGALVALSGLKALEGERDTALTLLERAWAVSSGHWNLVLPLTVMRAARAGRVDHDGATRARLGQVLALRAEQAQRDPPEDAPWSGFDAATAALLLGRGEQAQTLAAGAKACLGAAWEVDPFAATLDDLERAQVDVGGVRTALALAPRALRKAPAAVRGAAQPFRAAARDGAWFSRNVPCASACPVGTDAGTYVALTAQGRTEEAYLTARGPNPFASVCARVCAAPCEEACRRGRLDAPVAIRAIKRFLTEMHGVESEQSLVSRVLAGTRAQGLEGEATASHLKHLGARSGAGRRVAVVGGGPAGLACAHDLALLGYRVRILEASSQLGGMMRHGIPEYRLPREVLDREIASILGLGVEVELGTALTATNTLDALLAKGYEAAFLGSGAGRGRGLDVDGADLDGVVRAIDFLINVHRGYRMDLGQRVVVVGGGNVSIDVARTARRGTTTAPPAAATRAAARDMAPALPGEALRRAVLGAQRDVHLVARDPLGQWPAQGSRHGREEVDEARREGIRLHPLRGIRRILGTQGHVVAVELAEVVRLTDAEGRPSPVYGPNAAETIPCDAVVLAIGQEPDLDYLRGTIGLERTKNGLIAVDAKTLETSRPGVFAGGDAAFGPRTLIQAVAEGKRAARSIHARLAGTERLPLVFQFEEVEPRGVALTPHFDVIERHDPACVPLDRRTGIAEVEGGFSAEEARRQASRCLSCHVQTVFNGELCIACGRCVDICPERCLSLVSAADVEGEDLDSSACIPAEEGGGQSAMLKDEDRCVRCGLCAERCPSGAMTMERYHFHTAEASA